MVYLGTPFGTTLVSVGLLLPPFGLHVEAHRIHLFAALVGFLTVQGGVRAGPQGCSVTAFAPKLFPEWRRSSVIDQAAPRNQTPDRPLHGAARTENM